MVEQSPAHGGDGKRLATLLTFVDRLTLRRAVATSKHLAELRERGFGPAAVVKLAQAVAFVNYELRLLAGLAALADAGPPGTLPEMQPVMPPASLPATLPATQTSPAAGLWPALNTLADTPPSHGGFTLDLLAWHAWRPTVDTAQATPEQLAVLDEGNAAARASPYYLTLLHNPGVLRQRSRLFNAIMLAAEGLPRAQRKLATVAVSRINGGPYCASVHASSFAQLTREPHVVEVILAQGVNALLPAQSRIASLRLAGWDDGEILDAVHAWALFAWANRRMQTLGEPVGTGWARAPAPARGSGAA